MSYESIKELVDRFEHSDIREMNVSIEGLSLYLSKNDSKKSHDIVVKEHDNQVKEVSVSEVETTDVSPKVEDISGQTIKSPIVGVVYTASEPGKPNFVSVGDSVQVGDTLCIIEAMKIMNDVVSDVSGVVTEVFVTNEEVVEFGQPLFKIS
ncbi:acetyl-CoA carboxylase, biotin carboxyl carrier protein [Vagococcus martis]|uniref:Biotin carboxyl carrier protein of acetyl-CoA carboxylase n=1 Tax=Vagococcus martis TaxID=1768210 RepID=A0A1V4DEA0_9ENTE|nr:acetyl-CoA carboxylase biotin carboxyl carrier protein [Vagococcus martis]OPF86815.1 acetyl-CoA carboxylase, biotin carboxyl carrier protein [Vagococcus martis]